VNGKWKEERKTRGRKKGGNNKWPIIKHVVSCTPTRQRMVDAGETKKKIGTGTFVMTSIWHRDWRELRRKEPEQGGGKKKGESTKKKSDQLKYAKKAFLGLDEGRKKEAQKLKKVLSHMSRQTLCKRGQKNAAHEEKQKT